MAFDPLTPAPRLPEDLTVVFGKKAPSGGLEAMLAQSPAGDVTHVSLVKTRTPTYWASSYYLEVYHRDLTLPHPTQAEAESAADTVMGLIDKDYPRPPQTGGTP